MVSLCLLADYRIVFARVSENLTSDPNYEFKEIQSCLRVLVTTPVVSIWRAYITLFWSYHIHKSGWIDVVYDGKKF